MTQAAREHDPGPALGPVDVAHHQLLPAAHGDAHLVQPGRRHPHRSGDLPGLRPLSPEAFRAWSLQVFIYLLAYDAVRILIWLDHMGLRVATLVNLSFLGMDKLEQRLARFLAPAATARCIPEGVKRFTTWGPLLIPFYIPRGKDWDHAWSTAEAIRSRGPGGLLPALLALPLPEKLLLLAGSIVACTAVFATHSPTEESLPRRDPCPHCRSAAPSTRCP